MLDNIFSGQRSPFPTSYISWDSARNKNTVCTDIIKTWTEFKITVGTLQVDHQSSQRHVISIDFDFSENLTIPVKEEPQSLSWHHEQKSVHSGILKTNGEKRYFDLQSEER